MRAVRRLAAALLAACAVAVTFVPAPAAAAPGPPDVPQWWFDDWDVPGLWAAGARGQNIVIAEIDSGVNADLPELAGKVLAGRDFGDPTQDGRVDQDLDEFGHGTAMASLMVAEAGTANITGLAPDAHVLPVAIPLLGTATEGSTSGSLPEAIRWAADNGGQIISLSLGQERQEGTDPLACPTAEQDAILYAIANGSIVVAASGNEGENGSPVTDPGVCIGVVAVGAVDIDDEVASFSSRHPYLTVTAPGVEIPTLGRVDNDAYIGQGTSQATAIVSAGLALIWSKYPDLTNHQIVARMIATLDRRVTTPTADPAYGFGILDVGAAITTVVAADAANPVLLAAAPFLDRSVAKAAVVETPPDPVEAFDTVPGEVVVGTRPGVLTPAVTRGLGLAGAGVLALLALAVLGIVRRRRYMRAVRTTSGDGQVPRTDWADGRHVGVPPDARPESRVDGAGNAGWLAPAAHSTHSLPPDEPPADHTASAG